MRKKKPRTTPRRDHHVVFRIDDALYQKITYTAEKEGLTISEYVRRKLRAGKIRIKHTFIADPYMVQKCMAEIGHIEGNLHQIVNALHRINPQSELLPDIQKAFGDLYDMKRVFEEMGGEHDSRT